MRPLAEFIRTTLVGGILFLVPLAIIAVFLRHAYDFARRMTQPLARIFPMDDVGGVLIADLFATGGLLALAFLLGLIARTRLGASLRGHLERMIVPTMPAFTLLKNIGKGDVERRIRVALINGGDRFTLGFVMQRLDNGLFAVFLPSAPAASSGSVFFVEPERVQFIDMTVTEAVECLMEPGATSDRLLRGAHFDRIWRTPATDDSRGEFDDFRAHP